MLGSAPEGTANTLIDAGIDDDELEAALDAPLGSLVDDISAVDDPDEGEGEAGETNAQMMERVRQALLSRGFKPKTTTSRPMLLSSLDLAGVAAYMKSGRCRSIIVMCGAGAR